MDLQSFAELHRLKLKNTGAERVVLGRFGEIANMGDGDALRLRLLSVPRGSTRNDRKLVNRRKLAIAGGMVLKHKADSESVFLFDPTNSAQVNLAVKLVGARRRGVLSAAQLEVLRAARAAAGAR